MQKITQVFLLYVLSLSANAVPEQFKKMYSGLKSSFQETGRRSALSELSGLWKTRGVVRSAPGRRVYWSGQSCPKDYECQDLRIGTNRGEGHKVCLLSSEKSETCQFFDNESEIVRFSDGGEKNNIFRECRYNKNSQVFICRSTVGSGKVELACLSKSGFRACKEVLNI